MEELFAQIANIGFPIVIAVFLLIRMEKKMEDLAESIRELSYAIKHGFQEASHS